ISATVHSTPFDLEDEIADESGTATFTFAVDAEFELGEHYVAVSGAQAGALEGDALDTEFVVVAQSASAGSASDGSNDSSAAGTASAAGSAQANGSSSGTGQSAGVLATSGAEIGLISGIAALLLLSGAGIWLVRRNRNVTT
ncbi:MAG: hypothetical protein ACTJHU_07360, partial [Mycetocola sp.]